MIENDLDDRPQYTPWIAALWVEPDMRRRGIAAKLMEAARKEASARGHAFCYLCATPDNSPYYLARGFKQIGGIRIQSVFHQLLSSATCSKTWSLTILMKMPLLHCLGTRFERQVHAAFSVYRLRSILLRERLRDDVGQTRSIHRKHGVRHS
ncbi:GNAT family N-acetyltransferase [Sinorhizobium meliloti]|uniref:GNAT family N-acetyltransferase n=1 Tax=Rhizobium meliloti TaxID=382 RepID=UPI001F45E461|nr:GNAT family N-acetyltransferase [Sinorhizobium meliloti]